MSAQAARTVDYEHLKVQAAEDLGVMREVLQLFLIHTEQLLGELANATDEKSWKQLTHTLKGSARGVGAFGVADAAADAERAILDKGKIEALNAAFAQARMFITTHPL
jgi:HPt (histidine-containing phosphotransfer) domain-containing protein